VSRNRLGNIVIQALNTLQLFGVLILGLGILLIIAGCTIGRREVKQSDEGVFSESKGMILIGPIPIVWGFGRKGWMVAGAIGAIIIVVWILGWL
jgi:uncharacterized membrane protein